MAEFERDCIRSRTTEGGERAKTRGVVMGCKPKLIAHQRQEALARREGGESLVDIAVSHSTLSRFKDSSSLGSGFRRETNGVHCRLSGNQVIFCDLVGEGITTSLRPN